jgi:ferritin-like metal-binding protein YciE
MCFTISYQFKTCQLLLLLEEKKIMTIEMPDQLFVEELKDLYSAENQLVKALSRVIKKISNSTLKEAVSSHLEETKHQVERLDDIADELGVKLTGKKCVAMEGLIAEAEEALDADGSNDLVDLFIIAGAQRIEHYEIAVYGTCRTFAEKLGHTHVAHLLQETLDEEKGADRKLTEIAEDELLGSISHEAKVFQETEHA